MFLICEFEYKIGCVKLKKVLFFALLIFLTHSSVIEANKLIVKRPFFGLGWPSIYYENFPNKKISNRNAGLIMKTNAKAYNEFRSSRKNKTISMVLSFSTVPILWMGHDFRNDGLIRTDRLLISLVPYVASIVFFNKHKKNIEKSVYIYNSDLKKMSFLDKNLYFDVQPTFVSVFF